MDRVAIDDVAIATAAVRGASAVELIAYHVSEALARLDEQGGQVLDQCVVTIGRHPDFPRCVTIEAKVATRKPDAVEA